MLSLDAMLELGLFYLLLLMCTDHTQQLFLRVMSRAIAPLLSGIRFFLFRHLQLVACLLCFFEVGAMEPFTASELAPLIKKRRCSPTATTRIGLFA